MWHPIAIVDDLAGDGPHPVRLLGIDWALFRPDATQPWSLIVDTCPHRLAPLTAGTIRNGTLECAYHGWCFAPDGTCVDIPALGPSATLPPTACVDSAAEVTEAYGMLWASIEAPVAPLPTVPEYDDPAYGLARLPVSTWNASAGQMADNFLDVGHFPFIHTATIGDAQDLVVGDFEVVRDGWGFTSTHVHSAQLVDGSGRIVERTMQFVFTAPHQLRLRLDYGEHGEMVLLFFHQPVDVSTTRLFCLELMTDLAADPSGAEAAIAFQTAVALEDKGLLEQLRRKAVPLSPGVETHTKADRTTVALRRILNDVAALRPASRESRRCR